MKQIIVVVIIFTLCVRVCLCALSSLTPPSSKIMCETEIKKDSIVDGLPYLLVSLCMWLVYMEVA